MIKDNKEDCKWCNQGWIVCEEHGHSSKCDKYLNGHYKTIVLDQDETPPKGWDNDGLDEISECCEAKMRSAKPNATIGQTNHYICDACGLACDPKTTLIPLSERIEKILLDMNMGCYMQDPDDESFTPVRWENSPLLPKYVEQINLLLAEVIDEVVPKPRQNALKRGGLVMSEDGKTVEIKHLTSASNGGYNQAIAEIKQRAKDMLGEKYE